MRRGLTLMELLIAVTISLMVMGATVTLFGVVGDKINAGRALIEMSDHVRSAENRLRQDLEGATASFLPWEQPSAASGYFEILKGPYTTNVNTSNRDALPGAANVLLGYRQDVLMFTTRSTGEPFTGRFLLPNGNATTIESPVAEVVWYMQPTFNSQNLTTNPPTYTLYRRQFLIYPSPTPINVGTTQAGLISFYDNYDISARSDGQGNMYANSLADLSYRENRFAHNPAKAPFFLKYTPFTAPPNLFNFDAYSLTPFQPTYLASGAINKNGSQRYGEDVVLTNVLSFDVKVWDPGEGSLRCQRSGQRAAGAERSGLRQRQGIFAPPIRSVRRFELFRLADQQRDQHAAGLFRRSVLRQWDEFRIGGDEQWRICDLRFVVRRL